MNTSRTKRERKVYSASQKGAAILSIWAGRRTAGQISRQLGTSWTMINSWEKRALKGMLRGLGVAPEKTPSPEGELGKRLERLLAGEPATGTGSKDRQTAEK